MPGTAEIDGQWAGVDSLVLLHAKVRAPPLPAGLVERRALLECLTSASDTPVVLVSAPPGYGKTTLLVQWAEVEERPFAYVHLDEQDNDLVVLLAYVTAALEQLGEVDSVVTEALREPQPALGRSVLPGVANEIAGRSPFVLVLDDADAIQDGACLRTLEYLAGNMPLGSQLVLSGRTDPGIALASLRVERRLLEIRADQLAFDAEEARRLFAALGVDLEERDVSRLVERTEGWPAGLYLAALYLGGCDEPARYIDRFHGDHRNVADYFIDEVLARQPDDTLEFLRRTSILDRLSGPLCDAVLARDGSAAVLADMEKSIPFLTPLDEGRHWYRYHNLFSELLLAELQVREPEVVPELHRRAAAWYESRGFLDRSGGDAIPAGAGGEQVTPKYLESALRHALAAGDVAHAGDTLASRWRPFAATGRLASLNRMIGYFGEEQILSHAPLALTAAWVAYLLGDPSRATLLLDAASELDRADRPAWHAFRPSISLLRAVMGVGGVAGMRASAETASETASESASDWISLTQASLGVVRLLEGDDRGATPALLLATSIEPHYGDVRTVAWAALAVIAIDANEWAAAGEYARAADGCARDHGLAESGPSLLARSVLARTLAHEGDDAHARKTVAGVLDMAGADRAPWWHEALSLLVAVDTLLELGDAERAEQVVHVARDVILGSENAGGLPARLARAQSAVGLRRMPEPLSASELRVLEQLPSDASLSEIAQTIFLSRNTVKTHVRSIYRKLGVPSREEAVSLGRDLGLIP